MCLYLYSLHPIFKYILLCVYILIIAVCLYINYSLKTSKANTRFFMTFVIKCRHALYSLALPRITYCNILCLLTFARLTTVERNVY